MDTCASLVKLKKRFHHISDKTLIVHFFIGSLVLFHYNRDGSLSVIFNESFVEDSLTSLHQNTEKMIHLQPVTLQHHSGLTYLGLFHFYLSVESLNLMLP